MARLFLALYSFFETRRWWLFLLTVLFIGAGTWAAFRLEYEEDITQVMPADEKAKEFNRVMEQVSFTDKIIISVSAENGEKTDSEALMKAGEYLFTKLETLKPEYLLDILFRPDDKQISDAFDFFYDHLPLYLDSADYASMDSLLTPEKIDRAVGTGYRALLSPAGSFLKKSFLRDPLSITPRALRRLQSLQTEGGMQIREDGIFTADGNQLMIYLQPAYSARKTGPNGKLAEELATFSKETEKAFGVKIHYFGSPLVAAANASRIKTDIGIILSAVGIFLFLFLFYFYRTPFYYFILIIPAAIGASAGFLMLYLMKGTASSIAMGVGGMVLGITIDYSLHVFTHFREVRNIKKLLDDITAGMLLSSFTTVCAFYCLLFTNSEALRDLGIFAGTGVFTAAVSSLLVLPHLLKAPKNNLSEIKTNWVERIAGFSYHRNRFVIAGGLVFTAVCLIFFHSPDFEDNPENFSYMPKELAESEAFISQGSDVSKKALFLITSGTDTKQAMERLDTYSDIIAKLQINNLIEGVSGPLELMPTAKKQLHSIHTWNVFWTPEKKELVIHEIIRSAKKYGFKEGAFQPFFNLLEKRFQPVDMVSFAPIQQSFLGELVNEGPSGVSTVTVLRVQEKNKPAVYDALREKEGTFLFERKKVVADLIEIVRVDLDTLLGISAVLVFIVLFLSSGRLELTTITYIPLILSWVWTLGFMGILGLKFNIVNIIICTFVFGLGNDYCIFVLNGLLQDYRYGTNNLKSYKTSVFLSAFTTLLGVGALGLSGHPALRSIAAMGVAGIATVLFLSYAFLPWMFRLLITSKTSRGIQPLTFSNALPTLWAWFMLVSGFLHFLPVGSLISASFFLPRRIRTRLVRIWLMIWARIYIGVVFWNRKKVYNTGVEKFNKPGILVANHQSFIDVVYLFSLSPRIVLTANNRIYNNPIFGPVSRMAGFLDVSQGVENMTPVIQKLLDEGNIVAIFPEGTRSTEYRIQRFHKGAFKVAEETRADILPMVIFGTGDFLRKNEFWGRRADMHVNILPRIAADDVSYGNGYAERTKSVVSLMRETYDDLRENKAGMRFHRDRLLHNYLFLTPAIEWYCFVKIRLENYYSVFHRHLPKSGKIYDLGCGYGFMSYMLSFASEKRQIIGCDYDEEKILTAAHRFSKNDQLHFEQADLTQFSPSGCAGIVLSDVLHYLEPAMQTLLLDRCFAALDSGGVLLIRDGDSSHERHKKTLETERWSTRILKFNKTRNPLFFFPGEMLFDWAAKYNVQPEIISVSKTTSNTIWKINKS
jgi:1-acyl-sn-glycerol-3-phosphate acyltransferase